MRIEAAALGPAATKGPSCNWSISKAKEAFVLRCEGRLGISVVRAALASVVAIRGDHLLPTACKDSAETKNKKKKAKCQRSSAVGSSVVGVNHGTAPPLGWEVGRRAAGDQAG